jgi:hypothetical protein
MKKTTKQKIIYLPFIFIFALDASFANASQITSSRMVELTNESRSEAGLEKLSVNEKLEKAAEAKANDMLINQYFEHTSPQGVTPWYWFEQAGYEYVYAAENLAIDFVTAEGAHKALMESTGHRENILGQNYKEIGIAVVSGEFEGKDTILIVEEFGSQREHKITVNNAAFFETKTAVEDVEDKEIITEKKMAGSEPILQAPAEHASVESVEGSDGEAEPPADSASVSSEPETLIETEIFEAGENAAPETQSRSVPKVYAIKSVWSLKKVYVEDIYWMAADEDELVGSLGSGTAAIKIFIKDLMGGIFCALL